MVKKKSQGRAKVANGPDPGTGHARAAARPAPANGRHAAPAPTSPPTPAPGKPEGRVVRWVWRDDGGVFGVLRIKAAGDDQPAASREGNHYFVRQLTNHTFLLTKLVSSGQTVTYTVFAGASPVCGCEGWRRRESCKHVDALLALRALGKA